MDLTQIWQAISNFFQSAGETVVSSFVKTFLVEDRYKLFLSGLKNTLVIAVFATLIGVVVGLLVAVVKVYHAQSGRMKFFNWLFNLYTTVIRGTPVMVQLLITCYIIFAFSRNDIMISIFAFGVNSGAYVSEIIRAGILAVDKGQLEAGRSLGVSHGVAMVHIVLPQAFKNVLPALGNEFIAILKETSVAGYIAVVDLTKAGSLVRNLTFEPYFSLLSVAAVYLVLVMGMTAIFKRIEKRLARSDRN